MYDKYIFYIFKIIKKAKAIKIIDANIKFTKPTFGLDKVKLSELFFFCSYFAFLSEYISTMFE